MIKNAFQRTVPSKGPLSINCIQIVLSTRLALISSCRFRRHCSISWSSLGKFKETCSYRYTRLPFLHRFTILLNRNFTVQSTSLVCIQEISKSGFEFLSHNSNRLYPTVETYMKVNRFRRILSKWKWILILKNRNNPREIWMSYQRTDGKYVSTLFLENNNSFFEVNFACVIRR